MDEISVDSRRPRSDNPLAMGDVQRVTGLTDATGHLWSARHELMAAGYGSWTDALLELIDTIRLEIDWLSSEDGGPGAAR